jgi:hypothetical protein
MFAPERRKFSFAAQRHVPLVSRVHRRVERNRFVPEYAQHLHALSVVPHGPRDGAAWPRHSNHLVQRFRRIRDEIEHQERERPVEASIAEPKLLRVTDFEPDEVPWMTRPGKVDIRCGGINADNAAGRGNHSDSRYQRASARTDVQHGIAVANSGESNEERSKLATPSPHESLVRITR